MGMDVYGKNPDDPQGKYFRNNVWWWRPLWDYCLKVMDDLQSKVPYGHSNDGQGLDTEGSRELAAMLRAELESGRTALYKHHRDEELARRPDERCSLCHGTKVRPMEPHKGEKCNACDGKGYTKSFDTHYPFSTENVEEFATFLEHCGGFEIC